MTAPMTWRDEMRTLRTLTIPTLAIRLAELRYCVVPLAPGKKKPMADLLPLDPRNGRPSVGLLVRRPLTADQVREIAATRPGLNWALHLHGTGLVVLDMDDVAAFRAEGWVPPATPTVATHRGFQFWFAADGRTFRKSSYTIRVDGQAIGEFKTGGHRMLPGSVHPEGTLYAWVPGMGFGEVPLALMPGWLVELIEAEERGSTSSTASPDRTGHASQRTVHGSVEGGLAPSGSPLSTTSRTASVHSRPVDSMGEWSLDLSIAFWDQEVARRLMLRAGVEAWPGLDVKFPCVLPGHKHGDRDPSASVWRNERGELRFRCFAGHHGQGAWSLTHVFVFLATGQESVLARRRQTPGGPQGGLGKGALKAWTARMLVELGFATALPFELLDPEGASDGTLKVWRGFKRLLAIQALYDTSALYCAPYSVAFAALWSGVSGMTAQRALSDLTDQGFLRIVAVLPSRVRVLVAGPAAFEEGHVIDWWKEPPPSWTLPGLLRRP